MNFNIVDIVHASGEHVAEHTEVATSEGLLDTFGINPSLFIFQLINFGIVFLILWFLILKPLSKKISERQEMIDKSIENSKKIEDALKRGESSYQEKIDTAKAEASMILERAKNESDTLAEQSKIKTRQEIEILVDQAKNKIKIEKEQMVVELRSETADLVVTALEKVLSEKIDSSIDKKLISEALTKLN